MMEYFSLKCLIKDFLKIYPERDRKLMFIPFILSFLLVYFVNIDMELINILLVSLSIFIGFLLNLLLSSFNLKNSDAKPTEYGGKLWNISDFILEYYVTISFEILITFSLVCFLLMSVLLHKWILVLPVSLIFYFKLIFNFVFICLLVIFILILFRVLKLGYILIKYHLEN